MKLHRLLVLSALFAALFSSCKKSGSDMSDAVITGYDTRTCRCCGGLMINFNGNPQPYAEEFKVVKNDADFGFSSSQPFPVYVKVSWVSEPECSGNEIRVIKLERR